MITIKEAISTIAKYQPKVIKQQVSIEDALGSILTEEIIAPEPLPRYTNSAMDGFALKWKDVDIMKSRKPVKLTAIGESKAGEPFRDTIRKGQAVRINTGAMLPNGADTVVPIEDVEEKENQIIVKTVKKENQHVRFRGEELQTDDIVLRQGDKLTPAGIGILSSFGIKSVRVVRPPKVGIIITGSELVSSDSKIQPWQIYDSNGVMLRAAVQNSGGEVVYSSRSRDCLEIIKQKIHDASDVSQILLLSGGVSVGPHDHVKQAAEEEGFETLFWRVRQKPGKPLFFAKKEDVLLFGLPGTPGSALNCYVYYVHPLITRLQGKEFIWETICCKSNFSIENPGKHSLFNQVRLERLEDNSIQMMPILKQGSNMFTSMSQSDGFILLEPGQRIKEGEKVCIHLYPWSR